MRSERGDDHRHEPAERRAEENRFGNAELVEQLEHVGRIGRRHVARRIRIALALPAAAEVDDDYPPVAGIARRRHSRNRARCGSGREAQQRRAVSRPGIVAIVEPQPVAAGPVTVVPTLTFAVSRYPSSSYRELVAAQRNPTDPIPGSSSLATHSTTPSSRRTSRNATPRFLNRRWAEQVGLGNLDDEELGTRISAGSSRCRTICRSRWRCAITATSSACTIPTSATAAASCSRSCATTDGRLLDLGTKGSGQTPYSRTADGRLTLKGGVREVLATEMLEALGVNTSKTFALFETGEELERGDEPSPTRSAVLTRLSHGHIRIGTFQRLAFFGEVENIDALVALLPRASLRRAARRRCRRMPLRLFDLRLRARPRGSPPAIIAAGFVHGVLNSDNINVTGESFDYGPWRFTPDWDADFTAAYFDHSGLYAFGRQPEAIHWDLAQLAGCLALIARGAAAVRPARRAGPDRFEDALVDALARAARRRTGEARRRTARWLPRCSRRLQSREASASTASSSTGAAAAIPGDEAYPSEPFRALARAPRRPRNARSPIHIGRTRSPARCISTRSKRSGRRSPSATTGRRSRPRSPQSAGWARQ